MRKRRKTLVLVLCLAALLTLILTAARDNQPTYQGHTLEYWLKVYDPSASFVTHDRTEAEEAVRHIGTNALPLLVKWISYEPHDWQKRLANVIVRLPQPARSSAVLHSTTYSREKLNCSMLARGGFQILGEEAAPAIPDLVRLLHGKNWASRERAAGALALIGRPGFLPLLDALSDTNYPSRGGVASTIGSMRELGTNASPAVPLLICCIRDSDPATAISAIQALAKLRIEPETVVPALTNAFAAENTNVRHAAVRAFASGFGTLRLSDHANQAAPALRGMLNDPYFRVREEASNILAQIATEAITNPPAQ